MTGDSADTGRKPIESPSGGHDSGLGKRCRRQARHRGEHRGRRRGRWWKKLLALLVSFVVACLLLELLVVLIFGEQVKFPRRVVEAPWGLRYNEPGSRYRHKSADGTWRFRINQQGMRADREYGYEKPAGVLRIISLGDSFTIGYEVDVSDTFSAVLQRQLTQAGVNVEVINAGVSGYSNAEACLYLERELIKYDPDLVVLSFYGNDLTDNVRTGLFRLQDGQLTEHHQRYVPAGKLGNFLNTNWFFNLLSERSNAFVFVKETMTAIVKRRMVRQNRHNLAQSAAKDDAGGDTPRDNKSAAGTDSPDARRGPPPFQDKLTAAIVDRMYAYLRQRNVRTPDMGWSKCDRLVGLDGEPKAEVSARKDGVQLVQFLAEIGEGPRPMG